MSPYLSALTPQVAFTHTVREFIRELLKRFIPGKWIDHVIPDSDAAFDAKLDAALIGLDEKTATRKDYRASVVAVLCDEVSSICEVTRLVCINRGYDEYATSYLSSEKFVKSMVSRGLSLASSRARQRLDAHRHAAAQALSIFDSPARARNAPQCGEKASRKYT